MLEFVFSEPPRCRERPKNCVMLIRNLNRDDGGLLTDAHLDLVRKREANW